MTVDEVKAAKKQMEATILGLIQTFEQESGLQVKGLTVSPLWTLGPARMKTLDVTSEVAF